MPVLIERRVLPRLHNAAPARANVANPSSSGLTNLHSQPAQLQSLERADGGLMASAMYVVG